MSDDAVHRELLSIVSPPGIRPEDDQRHLLHFWPQLSPEERDLLAAQVRSLLVDPETKSSRVAPLGNVFRDSLRFSSQPPSRIEAPDPTTDVVDLNEPAASQSLLSPDVRRGYLERGIGLLGRGECAAIVLAGGSGTRLGVAFAKGKLVCPDLLEPKSLFQLQCEKLRAVELFVDDWQSRRAVHHGGTSVPDPNSSTITCCIPIAFMTSAQNDRETRDFFSHHGFFGLKPSQVHFFVQAQIPSFTTNGKIILEQPNRIATNPNGNAGIYRALADSGLLDKLDKKFNVRYVHVVTVDNLLVRIADPVFYGVSDTHGCDVAAKTTPKAHDHEAVGVFARRSYPGDASDAPLKWGVVEYTEIGQQMAAARREGTNERRFDCGNVAMHVYSMSFLRECASKMQQLTYYHIARKPIPTRGQLIDAVAVYGLPEGTVKEIATDTIPGIKLEAFIFDLFQFSRSLKLVSVERSAEFSAVKNSESKELRDSPKSAVADLHRLHRKWLRARLEVLCSSHSQTDAPRAALAQLLAESLDDDAARPEPRVAVEISPLASGDGGASLDAHLGAAALNRIIAAVGRAPFAVMIRPDSLVVEASSQ